MQNQLQSLYGTRITAEDIVRIGKVVGIEVEFRNPRSVVELAKIIRMAQQQLPYVKDRRKIHLKFENKNIMEINSYPFRLKELPKVLKKWSILKEYGLTSMHLSYSGESWEILNKIALTAGLFAPIWRSFWNQKHLDSWSQCWPHIRGNTILPREFGVVSIVSEHRYEMSTEIRYVGKQIEALSKILPFALENYNRITDEDFKTPEPDIPFLDELKSEITDKIKFPHYTKNVLSMVTWSFWIPYSSLFNKFLPDTCKYCVDNRDDLLEMYTSLTESYSKERKHPHLYAAKDVANITAKMTINEVYEVLHF